MIYALMILILLLVIAPVIAIMPTAKQKAQMKKRRLAMAAGIRVDLTLIDDPDPNPEKYLSSTGQPLERKLRITAYRLYRKHPLGGASMPISWQLDRLGNGSADWAEVDTDRSRLPDQLLALIQSRLKLFPADVIRIAEKQGLVSVYWHERSDVAPVLDFLKRAVAVDMGSSF